MVLKNSVSYTFTLFLWQVVRRHFLDSGGVKCKMQRKMYKNHIHGHIYLRSLSAHSTTIHWKHHQYLETVCAVCRANEWQGSSPLALAGEGQKLFVPLSRAFMPEESRTVILTLSFFLFLPLFPCLILLCFHGLCYIYHKPLRSKPGYPPECARTRTMFIKQTSCHCWV